MLEAHRAIFKGCEARVGDSDPVGVTCQVFKDVLGLLNGLAHTDDPVVFIEFVFELLEWFIKA